MGTAIASFLEFVVKNWKPFIITALIIFAAFSFKGCVEKNKTIEDLKALSHFNDSLSDSKITVWKDSYGAEHSEVENLTADKQALTFYADSIAKLLQVHPSDVTAISKVDLVTRIDTVVHVDTVRRTVTINNTPVVISGLDLHYDNKDWTHISIIHGFGVDSLHLIINDQLSRVDYTKKSWLLGTTHYYSDFYNSNPDVHLKTYRGVELKATTTRWGVGPFVGAGYNLISIDLKKPIFVAGVSLQYNIIRF